MMMMMMNFRFFSYDSKKSVILFAVFLQVALCYVFCIAAFQLLVFICPSACPQNWYTYKLEKIIPSSWPWWWWW